MPACWWRGARRSGSGATRLHSAARDSISGGATPKQEVFTVYGQNQQTNELMYNWGTSRFGSGSNLTYSLCDAAQNNGGASVNLVTNSEFVTATTANLPDNWTPIQGAVGTEIKHGTLGYVDSYSLEFVGTATAPILAQAFATTSSTSSGAGGTPSILAPNTSYAVNCWLQVPTQPTGGVFQIQLVNAANTVIADNESINNSVSRALSTLTAATWTNFNGVFRTPATLPQGTGAVKLLLKLSTGIDVGKVLYIDRLAFTPMAQMYPGGPSVAGFSALTNPIASGLAADTWTFTFAMVYGAFQKWFEQAFGMRNLGMQIPSSGSPTISDSLVA